ncbi:MAG: cytochrome c oxidase subunit I [Actinobacteria bacterium]|nr:cytochrome c oxidase subunit I [Actinomycetota bacterium]
MTSVTPTPTTPRFLRRPSAKTGIWSWVTTVDHKRIGVMYGYTAFAFFILGGLEALLIRLQLATADGEVLSADLYNQMFSTHGITMIFLVVMPMGAAFFNYLIPLMIGARDVAFPRLNALSYWVFLSGGLFLYASWFFGGAPDGGWFAFAPLTTGEGFLPGGNRLDFYALGLQILGVSSIVASANFIVTILNMRAPGMKLLKMPVFIWMALIVNFLLLFAMPIIAVALFMMTFDRSFGTMFFDASGGGDPILWQHLFWLFGHPEVYILILPAMGIVSEILPTFSRKPLFGYSFVVFSGAAIGFMGWGVWAHHMFTVGLGPAANAAFAVSTMFIAVPTGVKIFNWMATMAGGRLNFRTPMLFAIGFIAMFIIGGLSGVTHSIVPHDAQQQDTYYIVAHFHYVLFGGAILGLFGGLYYWFPKLYGKMYNETLGKVHFWMMMIGFNLTFGPFHILGLKGMPRRYYTYQEGLGWGMWNMVATIGAFIIALSTLVFMYNWMKSKRSGAKAIEDPWDGRTLEWTIPSPPPEYNYAQVPQVEERDDFWHRKYKEDKKGRPVPVPTGGADAEASEDADVQDPQAEEGHEEEGHGIHLPSPSYCPLIAAAGMPMMAAAVIMASWLVGILGAVVCLAGFYGWVLEPATAGEDH